MLASGSPECVRGASSEPDGLVGAGRSGLGRPRYSDCCRTQDSYCSLAWGTRLAKLSDDATAAQIIAGAPAPALSEREAALADWARQVVRDPNATTEGDLARLREVGLGDQEIFEATAFVAFRLALSSINDALGAAPDKQLADAAPAEVRAAVDYGRSPSPTPSTQ